MSVKQVIVIRKDLKMRRGKEIAQGSHASMAFIVSRLERTEFFGLRGDFTDVEHEWLEDGHTKVCVVVNSEEELWGIHQAAIAAGVRSYIVTDAGKTEFDGVPTKTCLAIGPDYAEKIDPITGHLKLY